ncbi:hypothetical protein J3R82DRAFT_4805 [Butyriboletus roseoflavus]|nr:hypothetical protein J3R82DRAFT_4805 [Butyriboletus roseoflavus]
MSSILLSHQARPYRHTADLPKEAWRALLQNELAANVTLPFAEKALPSWMSQGTIVDCFVTEKFSKLLEAHTHQKYGIQALKNPYYDAIFTFCASETLKKSSGPIYSLPGSEDVVIGLRRADMSHLKELKAMFKTFSETLWPYTLDDAQAELEARTMITNQQVWVHIVQKAGQEPEVACMVVITGESDNVTAVSKVFTADILQKKKHVILYVEKSDALASARKVYHKVGFPGLDGPQGQQVKDVERWLKLYLHKGTFVHLDLMPT